MRLSETEKIVRAQARALALFDQPAGGSLDRLADFLKTFGSRQMSEVAQALARPSRTQDTNKRSEPDVSCTVVAEHLYAVSVVLAAANARATKIADLKLLAKLIGTESCDLSSALVKLRVAMTPPQAEQIVEEFIKQLKTDARTERFEQTWADLKASGLKVAHMLSIARQVYGPVPASTSRDKALKFIRRPHDAYMSTKRGIDAMGGRSAA